MESITSWKDLLTTEKKYRSRSNVSWIFRGQPWGPAKSKYPLASTLERACREVRAPLRNALILEHKLIREFASSYHFHVSTSPPRQGDTFEWLALMRHYGAPSRLLDFTFSFFTAAFFAANDSQDDSVIWAVERNQLSEHANKIIKSIHGPDVPLEFTETRNGHSFRSIFIQTKHSFVVSANPLRLNQRLTVQQGMFLVPANVNKPFQTNLEQMDDHQRYVRTIAIKKRCRLELLEQLFRMGLHESSLFPGLEGFAKSLRLRMLIFSNPRELSRRNIRLEVL